MSLLCLFHYQEGQRGRSAGEIGSGELGKPEYMPISPVRIQRVHKMVYEKAQPSEFCQIPGRGVSVPDLHFCKADGGIDSNTWVQKRKKAKRKKKSTVV